jgi:hypothetical protein
VPVWARQSYLRMPCSKPLFENSWLESHALWTRGWGSWVEWCLARTQIIKQTLPRSC